MKNFLVSEIFILLTPKSWWARLAVLKHLFFNRSENFIGKQSKKWKTEPKKNIRAQSKKQAKKADFTIFERRNTKMQILFLITILVSMSSAAIQSSGYKRGIIKYLGTNFLVRSFGNSLLYRIFITHNIENAVFIAMSY